MQNELESPKIQKEESLKSKILKNTVFNLITSVIGRLGGLIFTILIARMLQPEAYGIFSLATSVMLILLTFADLGINATLLRYVSHAFGKKDDKKAASYFRYLLKLKIILTMVFSIILLVIAYPLSQWIFKQPQLFIPLILCSIYMFFLSFIGFFESIFYAAQTVKYVSIKELIWQFFRIAFLFAGTFLIADKIAGALAGIIAALIASLFFILLIIKIKYSFFFDKFSEIGKPEKKKIKNFLFFLTISSITGAFFAYIDIVMLGLFVKPEFIGYYKAAFTMVSAVASFIMFSYVVMPALIQLEGKKLEYVFNKIFKYSSILSFPAALGLAVIAQPFIKIIYGESYVLAYIPMLVLSLILVEFSTGSLFSFVFAAKEKPKTATKILIAATIMNIILNYLFIVFLLPFGAIYAVLGSATATFISRYFNFFALMRAARKQLKITVASSAMIKPLIASVIMTVALILFKEATKLIWPQSIIEIIFAAVVYFIALFLIKGIEKKDFEITKKSI